MTVLRLDQKGPYQPTSARGQAAAATLDANRDGSVTPDELRSAPVETRRELFNALAWDEFRPAIHDYHRQSLAAFVADKLKGSPKRAAFIRTAEVANSVGQTCNEGVRLSKYSYGIGYESWKNPGSLIDV